MKFESVMKGDYEQEELEFIYMKGLGEENKLVKGLILAEGRYTGSFVSKKGAKYHKIKGEDGSIKCIKEYKSLIILIEKVKVDEYIRLIFEGTYLNPKTGNKSFNFDIKRAKDM